jgi:hypothetical protein
MEVGQNWLRIMSKIGFICDVTSLGSSISELLVG